MRSDSDIWKLWMSFFARHRKNNLFANGQLTMAFAKIPRGTIKRKSRGGKTAAKEIFKKKFQCDDARRGVSEEEIKWG